jgi:hypothetical protein
MARVKAFQLRNRDFEQVLVHLRRRRRRRMRLRGRRASGRE